MESQEQKSPSEDISIDPIIEPMAQPHRVIIPVPYDEIRESFDEFWAENEDAIINKFKVKGRKLKGGKMKDAQSIAENNIGFRQLYTPVFVNKIHDNIKDVLFVEDVEGKIDPDNEKVFNIYGKFYYTPQIVLDKDPDFNVEKRFNDNVEEMYESRLEDLKRKYRTIQDYEGDIQVDHSILVDIISSCDGEPYDRGTARGKPFVVKDLPEAMRDAILEHKKEDLFEVSYVADGRDPEMEGKTINSHIKIYNVQEIILPEINDELIKEENFENMEEFRAKFEEDYNNYLENSKKSIVMDHIVTDIVSGLHHPEVPQVWINANIKSMKRHVIETYQGSKERAMAAMRVDKEEDMDTLLKGEVLRDLVRVMAIRAYSTYYDLDSEDDDAILDHMMENVRWVDIEQPQ